MSASLTRASRAGFALVLLAWAEGCTTFAPPDAGVVPVGAQVWIRADTPFTLASSDVSPAPCHAVALEGRVIRSTADTVTIGNVSRLVAAAPDGAAGTCTRTRRAPELSLARDPGQSVLVSRMSPGRTLLLVGGVVAAVLVIKARRAPRPNIDYGGCGIAAC